LNRQTATGLEHNAVALLRFKKKARPKPGLGIELA